MKNTNPQILVSHPGKQHSHRLVLALEHSGLLKKYATSIWYSRNVYPCKIFKYLPFFKDSFIENELKKRGNKSINDKYILQFPYFEFLRELLDRLLKGYKSDSGIYYINQLHDYYLSEQLDKHRPDIVIGSETACYRTFKKSKILGITTILDLPSVHYKQIQRISDKYSEYRETFGNSSLVRKQKILKEKEINLSDYIITISDYSKETLINNDIEEEKVYVNNLGFDPSLFKPKKNYRDRGKFKILFVGQISVRKGIKILLEAYKNLKLKNSELILIGGLADGKNLINQTDNRIKYIPYCTHQELITHYQDADIFVLPSYTESWGMVVIEAMACGLPVIVSENTGSKEAIIDNESGFVTKVGDVKALEEKILFFYENRDKTKSFGVRSQKLAEKYTWENYGERVKSIVLDIYGKQLI